MLQRTYQYRVYPRRAERAALDLLLEQSREVYNAALAQCKNAYAATGKHKSALSQWPYFRDWRNTFDDLLLNASSMQHLLRRLDKAYGACFERIKAGERAGQPRYKASQRFNSIEYTYSDGCKLEYDEAFDRFVLYIQNVGKLKVKLHRFLPDQAKIKHVVLARPGHDQRASQAHVWTRSARKASGWYVNLMLDCPDLPEVKPNGKSKVGGDMGLLRLLSLSDGTLIDNPRWLRQRLDKLRRAQRRLARAVKGSSRRADMRLLVARLHEHIANIRRDFWHKITHWLVHTYGLIVLEDLSLDFMLRNRHLSLSAHDAGLGLFQQLLDDKAASAGCQVTTVHPADTSQMCSGCGWIVDKDLSVRLHRCPNPECLLELDRDVNAAINILNLALKKSARIEPSDVNVGAVKAMRSPRSRRVYATE